jgi:hypothetical protein
MTQQPEPRVGDVWRRRSDAATEIAIVSTWRDTLHVAPYDGRGIRQPSRAMQTETLHRHYTLIERDGAPVAQEGER